ncbi:hypothetical protein S40288_05498 [Stachybotrys chartarum IBT 40288]|nr:hypothetical protein S40288_05498 [Stachybotrys chartarum IBT 40288]
MPTPLPNSFASAAAGQSANRDSRGGRSDGRGPVGGDWSRRPANGTLTFRRSSTTPSGQSSQPPPIDSAVLSPNIDTSTAPPQHQMYESGPARYSKEELLNIARHQKSRGDPSRLFMQDWNPHLVNGHHSSRGWGKSSETHVPQEPGACWDANGDTLPMGLQDYTAEEREAFSTDINSPLKPPTQNKDGHAANLNGRKASVSHGSTNNFSLSSPISATRPGTRRRETVESNPFSSALNSPTANRFAREDSYWLPRKTGDTKDIEPDEQEPESAARETSSKGPFGNLIRMNTTGSAAISPIWPPSSATTPGAATGGFGNFALPHSSAGDKRVGGGSRLAHLIPKDASEPAAARYAEQQALNQQGHRSRPRTDTDPFGDDGLSGSAILGGAQDTSSTGPSHATRVAPLGTPVKGSTGDFGMSGLNLGSQADDDGPVSPSETNPYRSPPADRHEHDDTHGHPTDKPHASGHDQPPNFGAISRGFGAVGFEGSDRSQTSSVGAKGFPVGGMSGWPAPGVPSIGTPDRERTNFSNAFGSSLFSTMDIQSPGGLGGMNMFGPASAGPLGPGSIGRGSKLGNLFPPAMQAQMQSNEQEKHLADSLPDLRQSNPHGAIGRSNFNVPVRDTDSPIRSVRGAFDDAFSPDSARIHGIAGSADAPQQGNPITSSQSFTPITGGLPFGGGQIGSEPPSAQVRQMVMPDRMRWVYLDPQGQIQGPFTGLEMNDWYKANFFTPDLRVKKLEDPEFEPLGQLIRRIGNSREPFLVPQIGIPHGPPSQAGPFTPTGGNGIVPPLSGVFPSFGRTLTADEQNNLERRKQEEQFLMAQQRDYIMRQQAMTKFHPLQHQGSAQSLQSQPSFGSITSPIGMPPQQQPPQASQQPLGSMPPRLAGLFDPSGAAQTATRAGAGNGELFREEDLAHLNTTERQILAALQSDPLLADDSQMPHPSGVPSGEAFRSGLPDTEQLQEDSEGFRERLREFEGLRAQHEAELAAAQAQEAQTTADAQDTTSTSQESRTDAESHGVSTKSGKRGQKKTMEDIQLSLTQQVQQTQAAAAAGVQPIEPDMPMPFPPPSSTTPLPAPTAQRVRSGLPEQYSRSQSGTPDTNASAAAQPPPLAPWAKDPGHESQKGPSLKEIQEAEALKAAKDEEAAAALRKAAMDQEIALMREKEKAAAVAAATASLPASSTWGHGSPVATTSPWASQPTPKGPAPGLVSAGAVAASKKTLADIQREEELRKKKVEKAASQAGTPLGVSKSSAGLAGKTNFPAVPGSQPVTGTAANGWATVGAGGKVKTPIGPAGTLSRTVSVGSVKPGPTLAKITSKPSTPIAGTNGKADASHAALDEFRKWVARELSRGITSVNDIAHFQASLEVLPLDLSLIADAIYANSTTMDGRHFAEEYVRRKKLADKGVIERQPSTDKASSSAGGWSEVAKKGGSVQPKEPEISLQANQFKVVPSRKKGKK